MSIESRLRRLEKAAPPDFADVIELIRLGVYYDDLNDDQRERYCIYLQTEKEIFEQVEVAVVGGLHNKLTEKPSVPTKDQLSNLITEIEREVDYYAEFITKCL